MTNAILCHDYVEILQIFTNILQFKGIGMTYLGINLDVNWLRLA
ncbi:hypothetical protein AO375_1810 [Moraxella catarrhalis]|nr:hypothetical protein AO375_1810 [Moraxella catarrhalis]